MKVSSWLTLKEAAALLGVSLPTARTWCETGKLIAQPKAYGQRTTWQVPSKAVELLLNEAAAEAEPKTPTIPAMAHNAFVTGWVQAMREGGINGRPFSERTVGDYAGYVRRYLAQQERLTVEGVRAFLMRTPASQWATRDKAFKALVCFGKHLLQQRAIEADFLEAVASLQPKRHQPARQHTVTAEELETLFACCKTPMESALVWTLAATGIRASELCALKLEALDLRAGELQVSRGKGNKPRRLGLAAALVAVLVDWLSERGQHNGPLFVTAEGEALTRHGLYKRLQGIGRRAGVKVHPHALRRAFVTINANKGRSLVMLQRSCGHSSIKTTISYCKTSEQEVVEAMKGWD